MRRPWSCGYGECMTVEAIKEAISGLPVDDRHSVARWLSKLDYDDWDRQMARDFSQEHKALPSFWGCSSGLPESVQERADRQFIRLLNDPSHPSIRLKQVGSFWSARISDSVRALALREGNTCFWFWIGPHDEYERLTQI